MELQLKEGDGVDQFDDDPLDDGDNSEDGHVNYEDDEEEEKVEEGEEKGEEGEEHIVEVKKTKKVKIREVDGPAQGITPPYMTVFEYARILGIYATAIENGIPPTIPDTKHIDAIEIAKEAIEEGMCPLLIVRRVGNTKEIWYRRRLEDQTIVGLELPRK